VPAFGDETCARLFAKEPLSAGPAHKENFMSARRPNPSTALPLALCIALALGNAGGGTPSTSALPHVARHVRSHVGVHAPAPSQTQPAGTFAVTSCADDGGAGTLRGVVGSAPSGSTIDLSALACSTITLAQGAIAVAQADLTLHGPSDRVLTIDAVGADAVVASYGAGTLAIDHLALVNGAFAGSSGYADGGCVYAYGALSLDTVTLATCSVGSTTSAGYGGGAWSFTGMTVSNSTITGATATQLGGGLMSFGPISITNSTLSGNSSSSVGGGLAAVAINGTTGSLLIRSSTITDNFAYFGGAGIYLSANESTTLYSTIVAANTRTSDRYHLADIGTSGGVTIAGGDLIVNNSDATLPGSTMNVDPMLAPLADNGGLTMTHALLAGSPAIDHGDNVALVDDDQRGPGFNRVVGASADIGAFEVQPIVDEIFVDGFDPQM
jgi:hypothetical protein